MHCFKKNFFFLSIRNNGEKRLTAAMLHQDTVDEDFAEPLDEVDDHVPDDVFLDFVLLEFDDEGFLGLINIELQVLVLDFGGLGDFI